MTSAGKPVVRQSRTTSPIGSSSFSAGMMTEIIPEPARRERNKTRARRNLSSASVTGPAAIFGSSFSQCKSDGTLKPKRQAVTSETAMLPPMTAAPADVAAPNPDDCADEQCRTPGRAEPRSRFRAEDYAETSDASACSRAAPGSSAVIDCMLTLSFSPSTIVRKKAMTRLPASVASNAPASSAQAVPAATVASSHGKR